MSWFTELAGKAESLLEKVDTVAATALTKEQGSVDASGLNRGGATAAAPNITTAGTQRTTSVPYSNQGDTPRAVSDSSVLGRVQFMFCNCGSLIKKSVCVLTYN